MGTWKSVEKKTNFATIKARLPFNNNNNCGFTSQNHDIVMRKTAVEGSGNFYYLGFFSMDPNKSTKASSILPPSNPSHCGWDSNPRPSGQNYFLRELFFSWLNKIISYQTKGVWTCYHCYNLNMVQQQRFCSVLGLLRISTIFLRRNKKKNNERVLIYVHTASAKGGPTQFDMHNILIL